MDDVVVEYLVMHKDIQTANDALNGLVEDGYIARKRYKNIEDLLVVAKAKGLKTIALTGKNGGKLKELADICIIVPQNETFMIQELHLPVYHALCLEIEESFWAE